ncbi:MAG: hypothetical protein EBS42_04235, partial [Caulobacteraceae bacterium]|nr:hypothetical protein [Caulobacteraceae bacterium]
MAGQFQGRGGRGVAGTKLKDEDYVEHLLHTTAHSYLLFFSNKGRVYRLRGMEVPERDRTARGIPIVNMLPLKQGETIQAIIDTRDFAVERYLFFATRQGQVKKTKFTEYDSSRKDGLIALRLREKDELVRVIETSGSDDVVMVSKHGFVSRFAEKGVRPMGRGAAGVKGMKLRAGDEVVSIEDWSNEMGRLTGLTPTFAPTTATIASIVPDLERLHATGFRSQVGWREG